MPLQNRVDPWARPHAHPSRAATQFGNRGILHNAQRAITKPWVGKAWVCCDPGFKGIDRRPLFQPGRYSELFFLDEATAFAAGHRPCAHCRRSRYTEFKAAWAAVHCVARAPGELNISEIDAHLHQSRASRGGGKITYTAPMASLPDGTFIDVDGTAYLLNRGKPLRWSFDGYSTNLHLPAAAEVTVLTPRPLVSLFARGFRPFVHASVDA